LLDAGFEALIGCAGFLAGFAELYQPDAGFV